MANNVSSRFKTAASSVAQLTDIATNMLDLGVYDREEHMAMSVLVGSLSRAMKVLDPTKYEEYLSDLERKHIEAHGPDEDDGPDPALRPGNYL